MGKKNFRSIFASLVFFGCNLAFPTAQAALSPLSFALVPPVQLPSSEYTITGARLSLLWGHHRDLYGLDLGIIGNITDQDFSGLGASGLFNITSGTTNVYGLQLAGATNINTNKTRILGIQAALGLNYNKASSTLVGLQIAAANLSSFTSVYGAQVGVYNSAQEVYGIQIGLVNVAKSLHGIQIGLLNFNVTGLFFVAPILNIGF